MIAAARREKATGKPPGSARQLFCYIVEALKVPKQVEASEAADDTDAADAADDDAADADADD